MKPFFSINSIISEIKSLGVQTNTSPFGISFIDYILRFLTSSIFWFFLFHSMLINKASMPWPCFSKDSFEMFLTLTRLNESKNTENCLWMVLGLGWEIFPLSTSTNPRLSWWAETCVWFMSLYTFSCKDGGYRRSQINRHNNNSCVASWRQSHPRIKNI